MKATLLSIFKWLSGKKTSIATIAGAVLVYVLNRHLIAGDTVQLISIIMAAMGIGINIYEPIVRKEAKAEALSTESNLSPR
jgi:hypothetical protein